MKIVLTGSPSTGKSTILELLSSDGWVVFPEAIRWKAWLFSLESKPELIKMRGLELLSIQRFIEDTCTPNDALVCFDRCVIDLVAYQRYYGSHEPDKRLFRAAKHSAAILDYAFFTKPHGPDYEKDMIRDEDLSESQQLESMILSTYSEYSVKLVRLSHGHESNRAQTITQFQKRIYPKHGSRDDVVVTAIVESHNAILVLRYSDSKEWILPGGKVEIGEHLHAAMKRELLEETGVDLKHTPHIMYMKYPDIICPSGMRLFYFHIRLSKIPQVTLNPREHDNILWIEKVTAIPKTMHPDVKATIATQLHEIARR